ncbi:MAG: branched-chain amino acid transport system ATP-binding protein livM [Thermoleophilaceae bacterium]|jgi:branched-chain amino acid transport system permease protein|nr:branched-chain amino acid transport system ATP-binding protein livM [Thermoleophilaceae bacterium]
MSATLRWWRTPLAGTLLLAGLLLIGVLAFQAFDPAGSGPILTRFLISVVVVVGIQIFMGTSGIISFGHVGFMAIGAYVVAILITPPTIKATSLDEAPAFLRDVSPDFIVALLIAFLVTAVVAAVVGVALVRLTGAAAAIATYGLLVIVQNLLSNSGTITLAPQTFYGIPALTTMWWAFAAAVAAILIALLFRYSRSGIALEAARADELAARTSGVDVQRARLLAWTLSAAIVGVGGGLYAAFIQALSPALFGLSVTIVYLTMLIFGGSTVSGAVVGAAGITVITQMLDGIQGSVDLGGLTVEAAHITTIVLALIILLVMMFLPGGLLGRWELHEWPGRLRLRRRDRTEAAS